MIKKVFLTLLVVTTLVMLTGIITVFSMPAPVTQPVPLVPMASSPSYQLNWDVVANGGSTMQSTSFTLYSTTGQNVTTTMTSSTYTMKNGFWHGVFENIYKLFLPLITKG
jgi:hypothetical protein